MANNSNLGIRILPKVCFEVALPYLQCLSDKAQLSVNECAAHVLPPLCDLHSATPNELDAAAPCGSGMWTLEASSSSESPDGLAYGVELTDCPDGESYGFLCQPPNDACAVACECRTGASTTEVFIEQITDTGLEQGVWEACGFPRF